MKSYVTINNRVMRSLTSFSSPVVFEIYVYIKSSSINGILCRTYKRISEDLGVSPTTVQKAVKELCKLNLLYKKNRFCKKGYKANLYSLPIEHGSYTIIPRDLLKKELKASEFMTLAYLIYKTGSKDSAYPSYNQMATDTGLARRTIISAVSALKEQHLLAVIKRFYISCKTRCITRAYRSNLYKRFERVRQIVLKSFNHKNTQASEPSVPQERQKRPRRLLLKVGWCNKWQTKAKCTILFLKKEIKLILFNVFNKKC